MQDRWGDRILSYIVEASTVLARRACKEACNLSNRPRETLGAQKSSEMSAATPVKGDGGTESGLPAKRSMGGRLHGATAVRLVPLPYIQAEQTDTESCRCSDAFLRARPCRSHSQCEACKSCGADRTISSVRMGFVGEINEWQRAGWPR